MIAAAERIFEFLEECAEVKGYTETLKRLGRTELYLHLFIDNFEFYFLDDCNPKCIYVEVKTQYIYSC